MPDLSLAETAFYLGVPPSASNVATASGRQWPPPPEISLRSLLFASPSAFPIFVVDPSQLVDPDPCNIGSLVNPGSPTGLLTYDYCFPDYPFLRNDPSDFTTPEENNGRVNEFLRAHAKSQDPMKILASAVEWSVGLTSPFGTPPEALYASEDLVAAIAQLAVTGRQAFQAFAKIVPQDADLVAYVQGANPTAGLDPAMLQSAASTVLDAAYTALWAIRANIPGWRSFRTQPRWLGVNRRWIAVSGIDDTPHRPVNVPTAPYPQFDISFPVSSTDGSTFTVYTRYMVASAGSFIGPDNAQSSSFLNPDPALLAPSAPAQTFSPTPAPRSLPPEGTPSLTSEIIVYIHGGGSRAEEGVAMANYLIIEGKKLGHDYTVISFDLPNSAYGTAFDVSEVVGPIAYDNVAGLSVGSSYHPSQLNILHFARDYVTSFIEALDRELGDVTFRIAAIMGGSLGGNLSLLLWGSESYLKTAVAWSATCAVPSTSGDNIVSNGLASAVKMRGGVADAEVDIGSVGVFDHRNTESDFINNVYFVPLNKVGFDIPIPPFGDISAPYIPSQPVMWYRAPDWQPCKEALIAQTRFDRYEIYSTTMRHWANAIDLEQLYFSFQDNPLYPDQSDRLLLASGERDNFAPVFIYNSTIKVVGALRAYASQLLALAPVGRGEFWLDTGHSFHDERPHLFATEIAFFLNDLNSVASPIAWQRVPAEAPASETDQ